MGKSADLERVVRAQQMVDLLNKRLDTERLSDIERARVSKSRDCVTELLHKLQYDLSKEIEAMGEEEKK